MLTDKEIAKIPKNFDGAGQRAIFKVLADTNRYHIFEILSKYPELTVSDVAKILKISIPLSSQHLKILEHAKILSKEKLGQKVYYKLRKDNPIAQAIIHKII